LERKTILIVDDDGATAEFLKFVFQDFGGGEEYGCLIASTLAVAWEIASLHRKELIAIIMDGEVEGEGSFPASCEFVRNVRRWAGFRGPIVANSSKDEARRALVEAGCDLESDCKLGRGVARETPAEMCFRLLKTIEEEAPVPQT